MPHVFSANRLADGAVVYLTALNQWSDRFDDARVLSDEADLEHARRVAQDAEGQNLIVAGYEVPVDASDALRPDRLRERIRSGGPTIVPASSTYGNQSRGDHQTLPYGGPEG